MTHALTTPLTCTHTFDAWHTHYQHAHTHVQCMAHAHPLRFWHAKNKLSTYRHTHTSWIPWANAHMWSGAVGGANINNADSVYKVCCNIIHTWTHKPARRTAGHCDRRPAVPAVKFKFLARNIWILARTRICMYVFMYISMYVCMFMDVYTCKYVCVHVFNWICTKIVCKCTEKLNYNYIPTLVACGTRAGRRGT
jgi:hypothetical protein